MTRSRCTRLSFTSLTSFPVWRRYRTKRRKKGKSGRRGHTYHPITLRKKKKKGGGKSEIPLSFRFFKGKKKKKDILRHRYGIVSIILILFPTKEGRVEDQREKKRRALPGKAKQLCKEEERREK